jgi:hypothetical protein
MKSRFLFYLIYLVFTVLFFSQISYSQAIYVDTNIGDDKNPGTKEMPLYSIQKAAEMVKSKENDIYTIKINPGIYVLDKHVSVSTEKDMTDKRIVIEASVLPDDSSWTPEQMPVITCKEKKGNIKEYYSFVASFLVDESHVTIRGFNFHGYFQPNARYFPVCRFNMQKTDLLVEQCMFVGDEYASHIQVGVIANGNEIKIDHCVFYNAKNAGVYWIGPDDGVKTGNSFTNCIVYGAFQCAVWFAWPDSDFIFKNNIITNCKHVFIRNDFNTSIYSVENSAIVNNKNYLGTASDDGVVPTKFEINENNITKAGEVSLRQIDNLDDPMPINYLHVLPDSLGYNLGAGLFKKENH